MLYCTKCKNLCDDKLTSCPKCSRSRNLREARDGDMVLWDKFSEFEASEICDAFEKHGIRYSTEPYKVGTVTNPFDSRVMPEDKNLYVAYGDIEAAREVISRELPQEAEEEEIPEEEEMSSKKRIAVQIISVIAFILIVAAVVFASDFVAEGLRDLLTGQ